jgi:hypothetical protein
VSSACPVSDKQTFDRLFDHLVSGGDQRNGQTERFDGLEINRRPVVQTLFWRASNGIFIEALFQTLDYGCSAFYELRSRDLFVHPDISI